MVRPTRSTRLSVLVAGLLVASILGAVSPTAATGTHVGSTSSGSPTPRSTITMGLPEGTSAGQVMVATVAVNDATEAPGAPEGWSLVRDDSIPGTLRQAVYVKVAGPSEPADYVWTLTTPRRLAAGITTYSGVDPDHPVDASAATVQPTADTTVTGPSVIASMAGTLIVQLTAIGAEGTLTPAEGLEERWEAASSDAATTGDALVSASDLTHGVAGTAGALAVTASQPGPAIAVLLALRPDGTARPPDTDPPDTTIDAGPPSVATSATAAFMFSSDEPASFTCRLDGAAPEACSSPKTYPDLREGPHTVTIVATDPAGNTDPHPAVHQWRVAAGGPAPVLVGAGDIADCGSKGDEATAALVADIPGTVFTVGDNAYVNGTTKEFTKCYGPTWGRFKNRTMPTPGNHEYQSDPKASGYYRYFGKVAGDPKKGYYDYTLGSWHVIVLNSSCKGAGGCGVGSPQEKWLRSVLAAGSARCTVAIAHHARFSSAKAHGSTPVLDPLWKALYEYGADLVISGHDHVYERFDMQTPAGAADAVFGIREIVVGTGGRDHRNFGHALPNSDVRNGSTYGVIKLTLHPDRYDWQFVPVAGKSFTDKGTGACHDAPPLSRLTPGP